MKALEWDGPNGRNKQVLTGRIITDTAEPVDLADGDLWIDSSTTPVLKAKVSGVVYEVVGTGGASGWIESIIASHIVDLHGGAMSEAGPITENITATTAYSTPPTETPTAVASLTPQLASTIAGLTPQGYWKLDDSASPPQDSSGNARHASATTSVTYRTTAGAFIDTVTNYVTLVAATKIPVADNNAWTPIGGLTMFCLAKPTTNFLAARKIVCKGPTGWEWAVEVGLGGDLRTYTMQTGGTLVRMSVAPTGTFALNKWHAIVCTISDETTAATIEQYRDSNTALSKTVTTGSGAVTNTASVLQIGAQTDLTTLGWVGSLAHFAIFSGVMSGANIQTLMDAARNDGWIS